jgi:hypothetical protein
MIGNVGVDAWAAQPNSVVPADEAVDAQWHTLYRIGAWLGLVAVALIPISIVVFMIWPPPETVRGHFALLQENLLLGLLGIDLIYLITNVLMLPLMLALYMVLRPANESLILLAITLVLVGTVALLASNPLVEMWTLSQHHAAATGAAERALYLAAGEAFWAAYTGTAYHAHYILGTIGLLLMAFVMVRSAHFSRSTAYVGIVANVVAFGLYVPGIGVALSAISGIGYLIWFVLIIRKLLQLGR